MTTPPPGPPLDARSSNLHARYDELTYRRLAHIKASVDPGYVFRSNHPIK